MHEKELKKLAVSIKGRDKSGNLSDAEALKLAADLAAEVGRRISAGENLGFLGRERTGRRRVRLQVVDLDNIRKVR